MLTQAPSQLFDNSQREAQSQNPQPKTAPDQPAPPENLPQLEASDYDPNDEEWQNFDWDAYLKRAEKRIDSWGEIDQRYPELRADMGAQLWLARRLPPPVVRWMLGDIPNKLLWKHLKTDELKPLKHEALRGFQQTPGSLRQEPVQKRVLAWLQKHPDETHLLLLLWALREPQPAVLSAVEAQPDEATLKGRLPSLIRTFGPNAVGAAIAFGGKPRLFGHLAALVSDVEKLREIIETAPPYSPDALNAPVEAPAETEAIAPEPDSEAARFWRDKALNAKEMLEEAATQLRQMADLETQLASARGRIKSLELEVENAKKREAQKAAKAAKKLEQVEAKWAAKYEELGKVEAREERKLRKLQGQLAETEADNKRHKRQVRQGAQAREEEHRKVVALEARVAQLCGDDESKSAQSKKPMDAVSSPPTTQDAPNRPVKVSKPSPLDEIFEWQAHGRRIRMTAREVRRLIDRNDEENVGNVMLELEALQDSNPDLRARFLERLTQAGKHYPRVLTHKTSRVLVDASNVARYLPNRYGKGQLVHLELMRQELQRLDCWPIVFVADASLPYYIDKPQELREMARQGEILIVDKGVEADEVLAREARQTGAYVVTNDAKFFYKVSPDYEPPRITFRVMDGLVVVDEF